MKKLLILLLTVFSTASFAQICYVDLVDSYSNYRYDTFSAYTYGGSCRDALRECNRAKRDRNINRARCVQRTSGPSYPNPGPSYPNPGPNHPGSLSYLLGMTDYQVADYAMSRRAGRCSVKRGGWGSSCDYYVEVNGYGYPQGTGCADRAYTARYGCDSYSEKANAGCMIKKAIRQGACR